MERYTVAILDMSMTVSEMNYNPDMEGIPLIQILSLEDTAFDLDLEV